MAFHGAVHNYNADLNEDAAWLETQPQFHNTYRYPPAPRTGPGSRSGRALFLNQKSIRGIEPVQAGNNTLEKMGGGRDDYDRGGGGGGGDRNRKQSLLVRNMNVRTNADKIREVFERFGEVREHSTLFYDSYLQWRHITC